MSLDILSSDILLKAQKEKEQLEIQLKKEFSAAEEELSKRIEKFKSILKEKYYLELKNQKKKILSSFKRDAKKEILSVNSIILSKVYSQVLENLSNLKKDQKEEFYKNIIKKAKQIIDFQIIICTKKDQKLIKKLISNEVKIIIDNNILGLKFIANNGKELLDLTYNSLLKEVYKNIEDKLQTILFNI